MNHVSLGRTGLRVSSLCLGTATFGMQSDEATSNAILDTAFDAGIDFLDSGDVYPLGAGLDVVGRTEEILGRWLKGKRDEVIIGTKGGSPMGSRAWHHGLSRKHILDAIDGSLRRLETDYVDLYQVHCDDPTTPIDEVLEALDAVVKAGKVRYVGASNWLAYRIARAVGRSEARQLVRFDCVQPRYNLLFRQFERELFPLCLEEGIGVIPYNPLAGGLLTGKHLSVGSQPEPGSRFTVGEAGLRYQQRYWHEREFEAVNALKDLAAEAGLSLVTMAVAWVGAHPAVTAPIIGATRPEQLRDSLAAAETRLDPVLKARLDEATDEFRRGDDLP